MLIRDKMLQPDVYSISADQIHNPFDS